MAKARQVNWPNILLYVGVLVIFAPKAYLFLGEHSDASIRSGQNLIFDLFLKGDLMHSHVPHGPLAFLQYPLDIGWNYVLAFAFYSVINLAIVWRLPFSSPWGKVGLFILMYFTIGMRFMPIALLFLIVLKPCNKWDIVLIALLLALLMNIRLSVALMLCAICLFLLLSHQEWKKELEQNKIPLALGICLFLFFVLLPFGLKPLILWEHYRAVLSNAPYEVDVPWQPKIILSALLFFTGAFALSTYIGISLKKRMPLLLVFLISSLYVYSRPDPGTLYVALLLQWLLVMLLCAHEGTFSLLKLTCLALLLAVLWGLNYHLVPGSFKFTKLDPLYAWQNLGKELTRLKSEKTEPLIGDYSVFPYSLNIGKEQEGLWPQLRPSYISYAALSPRLDSLNFMNLHQRLLVHSPNPNAIWSDRNDINGNYIAFTNAYTVAHIYGVYDLQSLKGSYAEYLKKKPADREELMFKDFSLEQLSKGIKASEWFSADHASIVRSTSLASGDLLIEMRLSNGQVLKKLIAPPSLLKGIFVDYFISGVNYHDKSLKVLYIRVSNS